MDVGRKKYLYVIFPAKVGRVLFRLRALFVEYFVVQNRPYFIFLVGRGFGWGKGGTLNAYFVVGAKKIAITYTSEGYYHVGCGCRMWSPVSVGKRGTSAVKCYWDLEKKKL